MINQNKYLTNGVYVTPNQFNVGDKLRISYDGLLSKSGANHLYAHVGFGNRWNEVKDIKMNKTTSGFEATLPITKTEPLYVCFKDCANNWDNNSGRNYTFDILD